MKYYEEIPVIRSIAAILVVTVHLIAGLYSPGGVFSNVHIGYIDQLARLGTPIFAVISAFLLMSSVLRRGFDLSYFVKSRFTKIFIPYLFWSGVYLLYRSFVEGSLIPGLPVSSYFLHGTANFHLYFILTVLQFYILFPLLSRLKKGPVLIGLFLMSLLVNYAWMKSDGVSIDNEFFHTLINNKSFLFNWIAYFMLGIVYAAYYQEIQTLLLKHKRILQLFIIVLAVDLFVSINLDQLYTSTNAANLIYIPFFLISLNYLYHFVKMDVASKTILTTIGNYSMGIYLVHPLVIRTIGRMEWSPVLTSTNMFVITLSLTLLLSVLLSYLISLLPFGSYLIPVPRRRKKRIVAPTLRESNAFSE